MTVSTCGSEPESLLGIYQGATIGALSEVSLDEVLCGGQSTIFGKAGRDTLGRAARGSAGRRGSRGVRRGPAGRSDDPYAINAR